MGYYHLPETQRQIAREQRRQTFQTWHQDVMDSIEARRTDRRVASSTRFDAVRHAYETNWKTSDAEAQPQGTRRTDGDQVDVASFYESAWKS